MSFYNPPTLLLRSDSSYRCGLFALWTRLPRGREDQEAFAGFQVRKQPAEYFRGSAILGTFETPNLECGIKRNNWGERSNLVHNAGPIVQELIHGDTRELLFFCLTSLK